MGVNLSNPSEHGKWAYDDAPLVLYSTSGQTLFVSSQFYLKVGV